MSEFFDEPASWYAEPDAPAIHFELLSQAIAHALSLPTDRRHPLAKIATELAQSMAGTRSKISGT